MGQCFPLPDDEDLVQSMQVPPRARAAYLPDYTCSYQIATATPNLT